VNRAEKLKADERFDTVAVMAHLVSCGVRAASAPTNALLLDKLVASTLPASSTTPRLVVFFSNGSFDGIIANYVKQASMG
jgi:UDP-N-acetylmuramate: L-alanyl-gamma-D-glutamyl-meso-diaminopimelate ligase